MDNTTRPKRGSARPGNHGPATNKCTPTPDAENTSLQKFQSIMEVQSSGQTSISTSGISTDTYEVISAIQLRYDNLCSSFNLQESQFTTPLEPSSNIEMTGGFKNLLAPKSAVIVSSEHAHNWKTSESKYRITQGIKQDRKDSKSDISGESIKHVSTCREENRNEYKPLELNASSKATLDNSALTSLDGQNIDSNISISKIDQNVNAPRNNSASTSSKGDIWSVDDILANPAPYRFYECQNEPKVFDEKLKSSNASKIQSAVPRRTITCLFCGEGTGKHTKIYSKKTEYFCCVCEYETSETHNDLQEHIRIHCSKIKCNNCSKEYTEGTSHVGQQTCKLCSLTFECRTQFDEHLLEFHLENLRKKCWECFQPVSAHYTRKEGKKLFFCCMCGFETNYGKSILSHNDVHRLKYLCKICEEEYPDNEKKCHNSKYSCIKCYKEFKCRNQLEDHYQDLSCVKQFSKHCRICNGEIKKHSEENFYHCCECEYKTGSTSHFQSHLHQHNGIRLFKCDTCGNRYMKKKTLNTHSENCIPLHFL